MDFKEDEMIFEDLDLTESNFVEEDIIPSVIIGEARKKIKYDKGLVDDNININAHKYLSQCSLYIYNSKSAIVTLKIDSLNVNDGVNFENISYNGSEYQYSLIEPIDGRYVFITSIKTSNGKRYTNNNSKLLYKTFNPGESQSAMKI